MEGEALHAIEIRDARPDDADDLRALYRRSSLSNAGDRALLDAHPQVLDLAPGALVERTRVAVSDRILGFARTSLAGRVVELEALFIDPPAMGTGVGRALVGDVVASARATGATTIEVTGNGHALPFYERVGFVKIGTVGTPLGVPAARMSILL